MQNGYKMDTYKNTTRRQETHYEPYGQHTTTTRQAQEKHISVQGQTRHTYEKDMNETGHTYNKQGTHKGNSKEIPRTHIGERQGNTGKTSVGKTERKT